MIVLTSLLHADRRLVRGPRVARHVTPAQFFTITLPACALRARQRGHGRVLVHGERFRHPKVIGGNYHVLAIDIYQQG
jgi:hypothetical protein